MNNDHVLDFQNSNKLTVIAGLIGMEEENKLRRAVFRVSKYRASPYFFDIPDEMLEIAVNP